MLDGRSWSSEVTLPLLVLKVVCLKLALEDVCLCVCVPSNSPYRSKGFSGIPGIAPGWTSFFDVLFHIVFFDVFFMVFASILDDFFDDFPMFFASLFRHLLFMFF